MAFALVLIFHSCLRGWSVDDSKWDTRAKEESREFLGDAIPVRVSQAIKPTCRWRQGGWRILTLLIGIFFTHTLPSWHRTQTSLGIEKSFLCRRNSGALRSLVRNHARTRPRDNMFADAALSFGFRPLTLKIIVDVELGRVIRLLGR